MPDDPDPQIIEYATPRPSSGKGGKFAVDVATVLTVAIIFLAIPTFPYRGIDWHFGHHPQWRFSFDSGGLSIGHTGEGSLEIPLAGLIFFKLLFISVVAWYIRRAFSRRRVKN